jgi:hypothetical protein
MNKEHEIELKNEIAHVFDGVLNEIRIFEMVKDFIHKRYEAINYTRCCEELPTKETIISEGEKQIVDWLEENDEREKQAYRIGFRRSFEYVLRLINK